MKSSDRTFPGPSLKEAPLGSRPLALILPGGAALGAWQGGVMCRLVEKGLSFHSVLGTSAGSLNGVAYFQDTLDLLRERWKDIPRGEFMRWAPRFRPPSLYSGKALRNFLGSMIVEERCLRNRRCWFYAVSVDLRTGAMFQAEYSPKPGGPWDGPVLDHVMGSIAVPLVFPPVRIPGGNGSRERRLVDGHVTSFADLLPLVARGARDFLIVSVVSRAEFRAARLSPRAHVHAILQSLVESQVSNSLAALRSLVPEHGLRAFEFNPARPLSIKVFGFKKDECRRGFELGEAEADRHMEGLAERRVL